MSDFGNNGPKSSSEDLIKKILNIQNYSNKT